MPQLTTERAKPGALPPGAREPAPEAERELPGRSPGATAPVAWHAGSVEKCLASLGTDAATGLAPEEVLQRAAAHGPNALPAARRRSAVAVFLGQLKSPLIWLLLVAAAIAALVGEGKDALVIVAVVLLNTVIGAVQEGRAERSLAALAKLLPRSARVVRGGLEATVDAGRLVPGDLVLLAAGDAVPADLRLTEAVTLRAAESSLTGESVPVEKGVEPVAADAPLAERSCLLFSGTFVAAGRARAVVVAIGRETELGRIAALAGSTVTPPTPLEGRIARLGRGILVLAAAVFGLVIGVGLLRGVPPKEIFLIAISQLVGLIPEGLPVAMTVALAIGVQRMARRRAVVRRLSAVETLGCTTVICTDKTGTLTRNELTVTELVLGDGRAVQIDGVGYAPVGALALEGRPVKYGEDAALDALLEAAVLCNDASLEATAEAGGEPTPVGDPTEVALVTLAGKAGLDVGALRVAWPRSAEVPFDAASKRMVTEHRTAAGATRIVVKGAPETILKECGSVLLPGGVRPLDEPGRGAVLAASEQLAGRALRVLAVALRAAPGGSAGTGTFLGLVGEIDPPRPEVAAAVARCRQAGIRPIVVTGDHAATGLAIAQAVGIALPGEGAIAGRELEALSDAELDRRLPELSVFGRVHPAQKLRIVEALQRRGETVAMTGDGVNDAPALVRADVGIAMGRTGTEVAKQAARVVLVDDDFSTIVAAVEEGRVVYRNLKKALLLLLSTSFAEALVLLLALAFGFPPPFAAVQILWNNLVTEGLITVNLVMEPAEGDEMARPPVKASEPLLDRLLRLRIAVMTGTITAVTLGWLALRTATGVPAPQVQSETFTLLAACEWFNVLNCRSETRSAFSMGLLRNPWLLGGLGLGIALQAAVIYWPPLQRVFHTVGLGLQEVLLLGVVASAVFWVEELRKLWARLRLRKGMAV